MFEFFSNSKDREKIIADEILMFSEKKRNAAILYCSHFYFPFDWLC